MVPGRPDLEREAARLAKLYRAKAKAEVRDADALVTGAAAVACDGDLLARVVLVKGSPGPADLAPKRAMAGEDGEAAGKALGALGYDPESVFRMCSRPSAKGDPEARVRRVRLIVEAIGPALAIAADPEAAEDLGAAFGVELDVGAPVEVPGYTLLALEGLEASLGDKKAKARVWEQFRAVKRPRVRA